MRWWPSGGSAGTPLASEPVTALPTRAELDGPPRNRIGGARAALGEQELVRWCAALLDGTAGHDDPELPSLLWLGGRSAEAELARGDLVARGQDYWVRVWAARAMLYAWAAEAAPAVVNGLADPAWRVREMAAKVVKLREVGEAGDALARLVGDVVVRVRLAAVRALGSVGEAEHAEALHEATADPDPSVRRAARTALADLSRRLDRVL